MSVENAAAMLALICSISSRTIWIIDGLDECEEPQQLELLEFLQSLPSRRATDHVTDFESTDWRIFIFSRETRSLSRWLSATPQMSLANYQQSVNEDMQRFIAAELKASTLSMDAWTQSSLACKIEDRAQGELELRCNTSHIFNALITFCRNVFVGGSYNAVYPVLR